LKLGTGYREEEELGKMVDYEFEFDCRNRIGKRRGVEVNL
jgi:hypothetical protein